jgi:hypothetical protein
MPTTEASKDIAEPDMTDMLETDDFGPAAATPTSSKSSAGNTLLSLPQVGKYTNEQLNRLCNASCSRLLSFRGRTAVGRRSLE